MFAIGSTPAIAPTFAPDALRPAPSLPSRQVAPTPQEAFAPAATWTSPTPLAPMRPLVPGLWSLNEATQTGAEAARMLDDGAASLNRFIEPYDLYARTDGELSRELIDRRI